jgi:hypothetical protein
MRRTAGLLSMTKSFDAMEDPLLSMETTLAEGVNLVKRNARFHAVILMFPHVRTEVRSIEAEACR